jgi:hypothetical protein
MVVMEGQSKGEVVRRIEKFKKLTFRERMLFAEALALHLWVGLLLKFIPFRWIPRLFSSPQSTVGSQQSGLIDMLRDATGRASGVSPWKNRCLVSSLAGRCMLRRRKIPSQLSLGVAKDAGGKTVAHAWLKADDKEIVDKMGQFTELFFF